MASPPSASRPPSVRPPQRPPPARMVEPTPVPGPLDPPPAEAGKKPPKTLLTVLALVVAIGLAIATALLVPEDLTTGETTILIVLAAVVASIGLVPVRWGWYVMGGVTVAFFLLNLYNLLFPSGTIFVRYRGSSYTFAVLMPAVGVLVGAAAQGIYRLVGGK